MSVGLTRASIFAVTRETNTGEYKKPVSAKDFVALRPSNELSFAPEMLESDEMMNDIGATQAAIGREAVTGSHSAYLRHSGTEGQEPQLGIMYESILGGKKIAINEYETAAGSTVNKLTLQVGAGANFEKGQVLLIKDAINGFAIRNVESIEGDEITLNFKLDHAPNAGVKLGKAILYKPEAQGHPSFSTTKYLGNGFAREASSGNSVTSLGVTAAANGYAETSFSFEGTRYLYNAIIIDATNKFLDFEDAAGVKRVSVPERTYSTPIDLAIAIKQALEAGSLDEFTVKYNNENGKYSLLSNGTLFTLKFENAVDSIAETIGFALADYTGALEYVSVNESNYSAEFVPEFDEGEKIIVKGAELFIGDKDSNVCICAQTVTINISKTVENVECICEESGIKEKVPTSRTAELTATVILKKHDASLLDAVLKNKGLSAMLNLGPKVAGNWTAGASFNSYLRNATVTNYKTTGDNFLQVEIGLKGFVTSNSKDIYLNFV